MVSSRKISSRLRLTPRNSYSGQPLPTILAASWLRIVLSGRNFHQGDDPAAARRFDRHFANSRHFADGGADGILVRGNFHADVLAALELGGEIGRGIDGGDAAAVDNHDAVAGHADFRKDVGRKNDGMAAGEPLDEMADLDDLLGIEADGGLVENDDLGIMDQGLGQADALLITARKALDQVVALILNIGLDHSVLDARAALFRGNVFDASHEIEIGGNRHIQIQRRIFGQIPDALADLERVVEDIEARDLRAAAGSGQKAGQDTHGGGLAGAIGAQEPENLALVHHERHVIDRSPLPNDFVKSFTSINGNLRAKTCAKPKRAMFPSDAP